MRRGLGRTGERERERERETLRKRERSEWKYKRERKGGHGRISAIIHGTSLALWPFLLSRFILLQTLGIPSQNDTTLGNKNANFWGIIIINHNRPTHRFYAKILNRHAKQKQCVAYLRCVVAWARAHCTWYSLFVKWLKARQTHFRPFWLMFLGKLAWIWNEGRCVSELRIYLCI